MNNIASERTRLGLTQEELAKKIDVARSAVIRWENGDTQPTASKLLSMANLFECSIDYLVGRSDERK